MVERMFELLNKVTGLTGELFHDQAMGGVGLFQGACWGQAVTAPEGLFMCWWRLEAALTGRRGRLPYGPLAFLNFLPTESGAVKDSHG
jgi:hypothetical protein